VKRKNRTFSLGGGGRVLFWGYRSWGSKEKWHKEEYGNGAPMGRVHSNHSKRCKAKIGQEGEGTWH